MADSAPSGRMARVSGRGHWLNRTVTFTVSMPRLLFGGGFVVLLLTWVFTFGILIGRGHKPEEKVPQLAELMPSPANRNGTADPELLNRTDLTYHDDLRSRNPGAGAMPPIRPEDAPRVAPPPQPTRTEQPPTAQAERSGQGDQGRRSQASVTRPATQQAQNRRAEQATATAQTRSGPATPARAAERFKYLYQVASYKDHSPAENFRARLQSAGMTASIETVPQGETTWYRVLISFVGTTQDAERITKGLSSFGINKVLMRSKRPV